LILAHRTKLYPNNKQATYFRRACGIRRFAYNWALETSKSLYDQSIKTSGYDLVKRFNAIKGVEYSWTSEVTKWAPQKAIQDAFDALKRWWKGVSKAPRFKKKGKSRDSFYVGGRNFSLKGRHLRIDKCGQLRLAQEIRFPGIIKFITISREADEWFVSASVDLDDSYSYPHECETQDSVGVDLGVARLVTLSTGKYLDNPRHLLKAEEKIQQLQRKLSRKQKGSNNYERAKTRLARVHGKVKWIRKDLLHKITSYLVAQYRVIGIEDLNVRGMVKNHKLAKHISDASFYEFRRQLEYKTLLAGSKVVVVSRWFPSSKTCFFCKHKFEDLKLSDRELKCPECLKKINRDTNAAKNIEREALKILAQGNGLP
jgi:putative transposase